MKSSTHLPARGLDLFIRIIFLAFIFVTWTSTAWAQICVQLDTSKDGLPPQEQRSALALLADTFAGEGEQVVDPPCADVYTVYHLKFGNSVNVVVSGSKGIRKLGVGSLEEIPSAYSQIVRALLSGEEMSSTDTKTRNNVTERQSKPKRVKADTLYYVTIGPGITMGADPLVLNNAMAFGYRYELDQMALDLSYRFMIPSEDQNNDGGAVGVNLNLAGLYFKDPNANSSMYFGGGMGFGGASVRSNDKFYSGSGLSGNAVIGYEMMRTSTIRFFIEAVTQLPFFKSTEDTGLFGDPTGDSMWSPMVALSVGGGFGGGRGAGCCFF